MNQNQYYRGSHALHLYVISSQSVHARKFSCFNLIIQTIAVANAVDLALGFIIIPR